MERKSASARELRELHQWINGGCEKGGKPGFVKEVSFIGRSKNLMVRLDKNFFKLNALKRAVKQAVGEKMPVHYDGNSITVGDAMYKKGGRPNYHVISRDHFNLSRNEDGNRIMQAMAEHLKKIGGE